MSEKKLLLTAVLFLLGFGIYSGVSAAAAIGNATYGIYTETYAGINYDTNTISIDSGHMGAYTPSGAYPTISPDTTTFTEGQQSLSVVFPDNVVAGACIWMQFGNDANFDMVETNMNAYAGGWLDFDICTATDFNISIKWGPSASSAATVALSSYITPNNTWQHVSIPLSTSTVAGFNLSTSDLSIITMAACFATSTLGPGRKFLIDNVVWRTSATGSLNITLYNVNGGTTPPVNQSSLTWSNAVPGGGWQTADQYMQLNFTYFQSQVDTSTVSDGGWGIQIYTDNRNINGVNAGILVSTAAASPAGLVNNSNPVQTLPMCWRIVSVATTTHIMQGANNTLYDTQLSSQYPCYIWMLDKYSPTFVYGPGSYSNAWDIYGTETSEMTTTASVSPNYVYFGADFANAFGSTKYTTGSLVVELYYE